MDLFAISDLQRFSGIKAHTIRMWEQRYNALRPERSEGNTRYYNGNQLRRLLNLVSLTHAGYRISELSVLPDHRLYELIAEQDHKTSAASTLPEYFISQMIQAAFEFDEVHFEKMFSACQLRYGLSGMYLQVLYPMLLRIGLLWSADKIPPAQEHFITNLVRQKLLAGIDALPPVTNTEDSWLLFLPEDEYHEIGLLYSGYLIRASGKKVIYLGASTSFDSLSLAMKSTRAPHLLFFMTHHNDTELTSHYIDQLSKAFPGTDINMAGNEKLIKDLKTNGKWNWIKSAHELEEKLKLQSV